MPNSPYPHLGESGRRFDRAGEELYIPQRLLNGTVPDALLDTYVTLRHATLSYVTSRYVTLRYVTLRYAYVF